MHQWFHNNYLILHHYLLQLCDTENSVSCSMRDSKLLDDVADDEVEMYTRN